MKLISIFAVIALLVQCATTRGVHNSVFDILAGEKSLQNELMFPEKLSLEDLLNHGLQLESTPTAEPSQEPTAAPTAEPSAAFSIAPSAVPSAVPSVIPSAFPSAIPSVFPSAAPSATATSRAPTRNPTARPSRAPTSAQPTPQPGDPTLAPTEAPSTAVPSPMPTHEPTYMISPILTFESTMTMGGVSTPELDENAQLSLITATAESMGITPDTVSYVGGVATAENRRLMDQRMRGISLFTTSWKILATTEVNIPLSATTFTNATQLYSTLTQSLDAAVLSGAFTESLQAAALVFNSSALANAAVTNVTNSAPTVNNDLQYPPSGGEDDELNGGEIAGIVIGCFVFVALIAAGVYYCMFVRPKTEGGGFEVFASNADVEISL